MEADGKVEGQLLLEREEEHVGATHTYNHTSDTHTQS